MPAALPAQSLDPPCHGGISIVQLGCGPHLSLPEIGKARIVFMDLQVMCFVGHVQINGGKIINNFSTLASFHFEPLRERH